MATVAARWIRTSGYLYQTVGAVLVVSIAALMSVDVLGRYFLGMPLNGSFDMIETLMALCAFWFMPLLSRQGLHISVTLFRSRGGWMARVQTFLIEAICFVTAALMSWVLFEIAVEFHEMQERSLVIGLPKGPVVGVCAAVTALMALAHLSRLFSCPSRTEGGEL